MEQSTYGVAKPIFILVSGMTVVHVHIFALNDQTFLKEKNPCHSGAHGESSSHQQGKQCWKGERGEREPQQIAFVLKDRHMMYI